MRPFAPLAALAVVAVALTGCIMPPDASQLAVASQQPDASQQPGASGDAVEAVWPENMASHGVIFTADGVVETPAAAAERAEVDTDLPHAILYVDYSCPHCGTFEATYGNELRQAIEAGEIALELRPLTFLDRTSPDEYSTRAANALAAVVDEFPGSAWAFNRALFLAQPPAGSPGLTDAQLLEVAELAGASSEQLSERVLGVQLREFTAAASESGLRLPVVDEVPAPTGTPAFYLDGVVYEGPLDQRGAIADFIAAQS